MAQPRSEKWLPPPGAQVALLGVTYFIIDGLFLSAYGKGASWIAKRIKGPPRKWVDRAAGAEIISAAVLLGLKTNHQS